VGGFLHTNIAPLPVGNERRVLYAATSTWQAATLRATRAACWSACLLPEDVPEPTFFDALIVSEEDADEEQPAAQAEQR
jgi:hypothetical protein